MRPCAGTERLHFSPVYQPLGRRRAALIGHSQRREAMRYVLPWLLGIPFPVLILLAVFKVI
jgi:hypothetical protein